MSGTGEAREDFAGEERDFRIRLGEIRRIEGKCGARVGEIAQRLARAVSVMNQAGGNLVEALAAGIEIAADDVHETLYQGLVGGGMKPDQASKLLRMEIGDRGLRGLVDNVGVALMVLVATQRVPEEALGEGEAKSKAATTVAPSTSPTSTEPASPSA